MACKVTLPGLLALTAATLTASLALALQPAQAGSESGKVRVAQAQSTDTNNGTSTGDVNAPAAADNNSPASPTPSTAPSGDNGSSASPAAPSSTPVPGSAATDDAGRPDKPAMDAATPAPTPAPSETRRERRQRERQERNRTRDNDTYRSGSSLRGAPGSDTGMMSSAGAGGARSWELVRPDVTEIRDKLAEAADHSAQARNAVGVVDASQHREMAVIALHDAALKAQDAAGRLSDPTINDDGTRMLLMDVAFWAERVDPMTVSSDSRLIRKLDRWQEGRPAGSR